MTLSTEVRKLRESKAFYAVAGAGDLAFEKLREMPGQLREMPGQLREVPGQLRKADNIKEVRRELSGRAQSYAVALTGKAAQMYGDLGSRALDTYESLAERGRNVVSRTGEAAARGKEELTSQAASTARSAQQATASVRKTAETAAKAATSTKDAAAGRNGGRSETAKRA